MRTIRARPLAAVAGIAAMVAIAGCIGLGYRMGQLNAPAPVSVQASATLDLERPENRVIVDQVGALSGRLSQLEGEAAAVGPMFDGMAEVMRSEDAAEGVRSFVERREAVFKGR